MIRRKLHSFDVIDVLTDLFIMRGPAPDNDYHRRKDGSGSPAIHYCESFNARLGDELRNGEVFYSLKEAQIVR